MSWDDDDDIGYGRPPNWTRFPKGRSGNPKGRPRRAAAKGAKSGSPSLAPSEQDDRLRAGLQRTIEVTDRGERRTMTAADVVQQAQIVAATKGNVIAQRDVLRAERELEERDRERAAAEAEARFNEFHYIRAMRDAQARAWHEAAARGVEPDQPWPHPKDLFLNEATLSWSFRGPLRPQHVYFFEGIKADRDVLIVQSIMALRRGPKHRALANCYADLAMLFDVMLPLRWQTGTDGWHKTACAFSRLPVRLLRAILASVEGKARSVYRPIQTAEGRKDVYDMTNRIMQPVLRRTGYRSLRQFEAAYAELGNAMPWPRVKRVKHSEI
jgi:hypothetical protein